MGYGHSLDLRSRIIDAVTRNVALPVIVPCGHAHSAKAHDSYQSVGALLALNGMAALVFDPIDQGERIQLLDAKGKEVMWGTRGHTNLGAGCILLGRNTAGYEIWDSMRALDYLQSRPEVDPKRLGCTGNSGGGTQTSQVMALEDRIKAAAPSCSPFTEIGSPCSNPTCTISGWSGALSGETVHWKSSSSGSSAGSSSGPPSWDRCQRLRSRL